MDGSSVRYDAVRLSYETYDTKITRRYMHELYDAGHLLEAGLAHFTYSGSQRLLGPMLKYVGYIDSIFGLEHGKKKGCGLLLLFQLSHIMRRLTALSDTPVTKRSSWLS